MADEAEDPAPWLTSRLAAAIENLAARRIEKARQERPELADKSDIEIMVILQAEEDLAK